MTIKQNGGIFGRNPTFNDVEIQGTLTTSGSVSQSGNFTVDTDTFVVDATNDRVGVNIALPTQALHVNGNIILNDGSFGPGDSHSVAIGDLNAFIKSTQGSPIAFGAYHGYTFNFASAGNLTTNGEWARIDSDGLKFNGDTAAANALSDYEQGSWTPAINGTADTTYSTQYGWYTKVGNLVSVGFELTVNTKGTITGNAIIAGLPFTSGASDSKSSGSLSYSGSSGFSSVWQGIVIGNNQSLISIYVKSAASGSTTSLNGSDFFANGTSIIGQLTYKV